MSAILRLPRLVPVVLACALFGSACSLDVDDDIPPVIPLEEQEWGSSLNIDLASMTRLSSGVYTRDIVVGTGATVTGTPTVRFFYTGFLASGFVFDTNVGNAEPVEFALGDLILGFNSGLQGMQVGGKRRLVIPSALGYGQGGQLNIPPNANLVFDVELVGIV